MPPFKSRFDAEAAAKKRRSILTVALVSALGIAGGGWYLTERAKRLSLDENLCPPDPVDYAVLLVDVTDPMTLAQRQDLMNKLEELKGSVPRYGKLVVVKVDTTAEALLAPVITRCNPGTGKEVTGLTGNPKGMQKRYEEQFEAPLYDAFRSLTNASGSEVSPILQSIQSVALTELRTTNALDRPRRLIVVSDLLQNTPGLSFYGGVPSVDTVVASAEFRSARTNLDDVDVELWMLERPDSADTQPKRLADLWDALIAEQKGNVTAVYRVSG